MCLLKAVKNLVVLTEVTVLYYVTMVNNFVNACMHEMMTESEGQVSSGEGGIFSSIERCIQEDRQEMGAEGSSIL